MTETDIYSGRKEDYHGKTVDLHMHSACSDGTDEPSDLAAKAKEAGVSAIALTDHDAVRGIDEIMKAGEECGLEVIPGVELSTEYGPEEVHVVGLFIDPENEALQAQLQAFRDNRDNRNLKMIDRLREAGFDITAEDVYERNPGAVIARPHVARYLVETGQAPDVQSVFDDYIARGKPCYVERYKITPVEAVKLIHDAGGLAILAHPCLYKMSREELTQMVSEMKEAGLDGIEALYSRNKEGEEEEYCQLAEDFDLLLSGGTDYHGTTKPDLQIGVGTGNLCIPYSVLEKMKAYRE